MTLPDDDAPFGATLTDLLASRAVSQQALADRVEVTRASVNDWCQGRAVPRPATVFAIERALDVKPGTLSRLLGYLPLEAEDCPPVTVPQVISQAPELGDQARHLLLVIYEELIRR